MAVFIVAQTVKISAVAATPYVVIESCGGYDAASFEALRRAEVTGRPVGSPAFIEELEARFNRMLNPQKRGPKRREVG